MTAKGLDVDRLAAGKFNLRRASVQVEALSGFFPDGEDPVWEVRQLTGVELARVRESPETSERIRAVVQALSGGETPPSQAVLDAFGMSREETPADFSRRIETLVSGSVKPALDAAKRHVAVTIAENFPMTFYALTNKIMDLTGMGAEVGKPKRSGRNPESS